jgi:SAM-dependent methyltransferase
LGVNDLLEPLRMYRPGRFPRNQAERDVVGAAFTDIDVARCYVGRPPYAPALFDFLLQRVKGRRRALDLGCGPGKIAMTLADHFDEVVALDPSAAMIEAGKAADAGRHENIVWALESAEAYQSRQGFDLVTAGTSIHWPDHPVLFPKLARWTPIVAVIVGDAPAHAPCGDDAWIAFLTRWIARLGGKYDPVKSMAEASRHEAWMDIAGRERFAFTWRQSLEDFIIGQHSRATWAHAVMGEALAAEFDRDLDDLMRPFVHDGFLELDLVSELVWGEPRRTARL